MCKKAVSEEVVDL